tara:strand:- start:248 stop:505 length:258 start_codon:yes stop_codon:yes gene_type:complete
MNGGNMKHRKSGDWCFLKGKTRHGKNRINQHGPKWKLLSIGKFRGQFAFNLQSERMTEGPRDNKRHDGRWVLMNDDPDFEVVKWV